MKTFIQKLYKDNLRFWSRATRSAITPFRSPILRKEQSLFAPLIFIIAVIWTILTLGIAMGSLVTLFTSLLVLYFIITRVFGIDLDLREVVAV